MLTYDLTCLCTVCGSGSSSGSGFPDIPVHCCHFGEGAQPDLAATLFLSIPEPFSFFGVTSIELHYIGYDNGIPADYWTGTGGPDSFGRTVSARLNVIGSPGAGICSFFVEITAPCPLGDPITVGDGLGAFLRTNNGANDWNCAGTGGPILPLIPLGGNPASSGTLGCSTTGGIGKQYNIIITS